MVNRLYSDIEVLRAEIKRLRGELQRIAIGGQILPGSSPAGIVPAALEGTMIRGNSTPAWERFGPPTPAVDEDYYVGFSDGDTLPEWKLLEVSVILYIPFGSGEETFSP